MAEIAIVGAGAVGRVFAALLTLEGHNVTLFARSQTVEKMTKARGERGFVFKSAALEEPAHVDFKIRSSEKPYEYPFDTVIYTVKSPYVDQAVANTAGLISDESTVIFAQGGLQWWVGHADERIDPALTDPDNHIANHLDMNNVVSMLVSFGASLDNHNPSQIQHTGGQKIRMGLPFGDDKDVLTDAHSLFADSFLDAEKDGHIFETLWNKACGSFAMSAYAILTQQTLGQMTADEDTLGQMVYCANVLQQAGAKMGFKSDVDYKEYLTTMGQNLPDHYMSILRDQSEMHAILELPIQVADMVGVDTQFLKYVYDACQQELTIKAQHELVDNLNSLTDFLKLKPE